MFFVCSFFGQYVKCLIVGCIILFLTKSNSVSILKIYKSLSANAKQKFQIYKQMKYTDAIDFLYSTAPMFQTVGKQGYKTGLDNTLFLDKHFGHPHRKFATIHVGGTNGKGSTSHLLAAVLQSAGYRVGLYTSPHLKDFRERIRVDGKPISKRRVSAFVGKHQQLIKDINPSFFEVTTSLAFGYFAEQKVDIAVIEVGLGGRLDCTNIISPIFSVITNISLDHTDLLGDTAEAIATEKAGIIKPRIPVIVGQYQQEVAHIFIEKAACEGSPIVFADKQYADKSLPKCQLKGIYQKYNCRTVLAAIDQLKTIGVKIHSRDITKGFAHVVELTGLLGRWQTIGNKPTVVVDTGHNEAGIALIAEQLKTVSYRHLHIVFGMVSDKKREVVYRLLPQDATYYFTKPSIPRALDEHQLEAEARLHNIKGKTYPTVKKALMAARKNAHPDDFIFVGGSTFVVADAIN